MKQLQKLFKPSPAFKNKKWKDAITLLNDVVCIKLAPSPIHGVGVFAMRDLKKGDKLYADSIPHQFDLPFKKLGELNKEVREIILGHFPLIVSGSHFMFPVTKFSAFLNHSEDPNYDAKNDVALRAIKKGEEVTEDYRLIDNYQKVFPFLK